MKHFELIKVLSDCVIHCNYCADACLDEDNIKMMVDCIRMDRACAEVCSTTIKLLASEYSDVRGMVEYCYVTCIQCAEECGQHDMQHCQDCAKACRKCAEVCKAYLN